jgi:hypothetical protein
MRGHPDTRSPGPADSHARPAACGLLIARAMPVSIVPDHRSSRFAGVIAAGALALLARPLPDPAPPAPTPPATYIGYLVPTPPVIVSVPAPVPPAPAIPPELPPEVASADGVCPAIAPPRDRAIGAPLTAAVPLGRGRHVLGVATSPSAPGVIAAWTASDVIVSTDDGATWRDVLPRADDVIGAAVDCHGTVWALRGFTHVGSLDRAGRERWSEAPVIPAYLDEHPEPGTPTVFRRAELADSHGERALPIIVSGGGLVAVVAVGSWQRGIAVTDDGGASWVVHDHFTDSESHGQHVAIDHAGRWRAVTTWFDCMGGGQTALRGSALAIEEHALPDIESGAFAGADGWSYLVDGERACQAALCALPPRGDEWRPVALAAPDAIERITGVIGEGRTIVSVDGQLFTAARGRLKALGPLLPMAAELAGVDAAGRVLALRAGELIRWSPRHGWRTIHARDDD